ncbi:MAG: heavy metal translocating P-type ATPase, partial [Campylobacteraceae bacterium]|nr:heavy metal translocating P-type ATPase [Campylobacteraceae bacterium]
MSLLFRKHQTRTRVRYKCPLIGVRTDVDALTIRLESLNGVTNANVNNKAHTFTLHSDGSWDIENLENELLKIDFASFAASHKTPKSRLNANRPDVSGLLRSCAALALTPLVANNSIKFALSAFGSAPLIFKGVEDIVKNGLTSKVLEAMAVGVSLARRDYTAANSTNALLELGEYIEESTAQKSDELVKELGKPNIDKVWIEEVVHGKKVLKQIPSHSVQIGDIVVVGAGESVAIDGHVISGMAMVNQASMTGEYEPIKKERGDRIMSGVIVKEGQIKIWAEQVGDNTATARIKHYILSSLEEKSAIGLKAS